MKVISAILAILIAVLTGCASQGAAPAEAQAASTQVESVVEAEETVTETVTASEAITVSEVTAAAAEAMTDITAASEENNTADEEDNEMEDTMRLLIGETEVPVTWEENASVEALKELSPITFEQVGSIGQSIVRNDKQTKTSYGDIVLYSGDQIVVFYGSNSWSYTRLGHIDLTQQEMQDLLGGGDVSITLQ